MSPEGQQAVNRTLDQSGQVIVPNLYGYPLQRHAFVPYQPYDGNYEHRPNQGLMISLDRGTVGEIKGDKDFADWARRNRDDVVQSFNAGDNQGGKDAHWPAAYKVLDNLIGNERVTYPGYRSAISDQRIPVGETFNYTRSRPGDYWLKYGNLTDGAGNNEANGIASQFQAVNAKNAAWANQTQVFDASAQNWKTAEGVWANTFGYLPVIGNLGNIAFGVHDGLYGMTANDRVGGNVAAAISSLQLAHELAPGVAASAAGKLSSGSVLNRPGASGTWEVSPQINEFRFRPPPTEPAAPAAPTAPTAPTATSPTAGNPLTAGNVKDLLPHLTPDGVANAKRFLHEGQGRLPPVKTGQDIDNATRFFNEGGRLGLKGGAGGNDSPWPAQQGESSSSNGAHHHPDASGAPESPVLPGLDLDAPLTPGQQQRVDQIQAELARGHDGPSAAKQPRVNAGSTDDPQPGPSGYARRAGPQAGDGATAGPSRPGAGRSLDERTWQRTVSYIRDHRHESDRAIGDDLGLSQRLVNRIRHAIGLQKDLGNKDRGAGAPPNPVRSHPAETNANVAGRSGADETTVANVHHAVGHPATSGTAQAGPPARPQTGPAPAGYAGGRGTVPPAQHTQPQQPSPLPEGFDLHAPLTPGQQQRLRQIQDELAQLQPRPPASGNARKP